MSVCVSKRERERERVCEYLKIRLSASFSVKKVKSKLNIIQVAEVLELCFRGLCALVLWAIRKGEI